MCVFFSCFFFFVECVCVGGGVVVVAPTVLPYSLQSAISTRNYARSLTGCFEHPLLVRGLRPVMMLFIRIPEDA